jgi:flagellar basal-body rod protein FlgB
MPSSVHKLLEKVLDYTTVKQKTLSENIANASTKNYNRKDVKFDQFLEQNMNQGMKVTSKKHLTPSEVKMPGKGDFQLGPDPESENLSVGNNVDIDKEMAEMAQNSILFRVAARKLNMHYSSLQSVIKGGSR